jgi:hypothetical protein
VRGLERGLEQGNGFFVRRTIGRQGRDSMTLS